MYPKIYAVYPKLIPKRGVGQFYPRLLLPASTPSTAKMSPMCPSGGEQHYKASGPLSMLYQCQYGWVRESTAAIVMVRPYVLLQCLRAGPSCSQRLLPPSSCCLSPPPLVPQEISRANPLSCLQGCVSYVNRYCWSVLIVSLPSKMKSLFREIVAKLLSMSFNINMTYLTPEICSYKMKTIDTDPWLNTITTTSMNTNTGVVSLRGYCTLPPATPASGGGDLQMESREMCKVSSCNTAHSHYSKQAITNCKKEAQCHTYSSCTARTVKVTSPVKMHKKLCLQWNDLKWNDLNVH